MIKTSLPIYLASRSPRRKKLLSLLNLKFKILPLDIDEKFNVSHQPSKTVKRLAIKKLEAAKLKVKNGIIITADTVVVLSGEVIGKPLNKTQAKNTLKKLSGKTHSVYTGFAVYNSKTRLTFLDYERTNVTFHKLEDGEINDYIKSGSPMDKAGAYGIQDDFGAVFVKKISGCYYNVVGLPLPKLYKTLLKAI